MNRSIAEYGSILIPANNLAHNRGSGTYNTAPNYELITNRGPAYMGALKMYSDEVPDVPEPTSEVNKWATPYTFNDNNNKRDYVVGSSGFHPEEAGSYDRPDYKNSKGFSQYEVWALNSLKITPNALVNFFFSDENVDYLQDKIVEEVYKIKGLRISKQSTDELLIIMRNNYIYAQSGWLPRDSENPNLVYARGTTPNGPDGSFNGLAYNSGVQGCTNLEYQIKILNKNVLQTCIKQILGGIDAYMKYYSDISSLPMPLSHSVLTTSKGANVLQPNIGFESGHEASQKISSYNQRFNII